MERNEAFVPAIQRAIRAQDWKRLAELTHAPDFQQLAPKDLDAILEAYSPFFQDSSSLSSFAFHPTIEKASSISLGQLLIAAIRLNNTEAIERLLTLPSINQMPPDIISKVIHAALQCQSRPDIERLNAIIPFKMECERQIRGMVDCAIRTHDREWMELLFKHPQFLQISDDVFLELIRWSFGRRDKKLIGLTIKYQEFSEKKEAILLQELFNVFLERGSERKEAIELYVADQLLKHPDYSRFSPRTVGWLLGRAIAYRKTDLFEHILQHKQYPKIPADTLSEYIILAIQVDDGRALNVLEEHPNFSHMTGGSVGVVLEEAGHYHHQELLERLIHHPHFRQVPEDSMKRLVSSKTDKDVSIREWVLSESLFRQKYDEMIYEAIRRNDSGLIDQMLLDPILKHEVIYQLIKYSTSDPFFVSEYTVRDMIREVFMTGDHKLISLLMQKTLFDTRIMELIRQSIYFDDEELIEQMILNPLLRERFHQVMKSASERDRKRLFSIFTAYPHFKQKPRELIDEVYSWKTHKDT